MATITQDMRYRLSLIKYAERFGVTKAAVKYKTNRQYIYRWKRRYDGSIESLRDRSRRPHHHPNQHTPDEIKLISDMRRRNPDAGLVILRQEPALGRGASRDMRIFRYNSCRVFRRGQRRPEYQPRDNRAHIPTGQL